MAELTDTLIHAQLLNDTTAVHDMTHQVPDSPFVRKADLAPGCYTSDT